MVGQSLLDPLAWRESPGARREEFRVDVGEEAADGRRGPEDQDRDADQPVGMHEVAAQRLVRNLFLIAIPDEDLLAHLDEEFAAGTDQAQGGARIQGMPLHVVGREGDPVAREKLPRLRAGGSPLPVVEPHGLHGRPPEQNSPLAGGQRAARILSLELQILGLQGLPLVAHGPGLGRGDQLAHLLVQGPVKVAGHIALLGRALRAALGDDELCRLPLLCHVSSLLYVKGFASKLARLIHQPPRACKGILWPGGSLA